MKRFIGTLLSVGIAALLLACTATPINKGSNTAEVKGPVPVTGNPDHELLLSSSDPQLAANKRLVYDMWRTLLDARDVNAGAKYLAEGYIQHNPVADTGRQGLLDLIASFSEPQPVAELMKGDLVAIVAEGDLVVLVQVSKKEQPKPYTTTWFDMFRVKDGLIVEHWDHGTVRPGMTPRGYVPPTVNTDHSASINNNNPALKFNKQRVYDMWRTLLDAQQIDRAPEFLTVDYIQHNPLLNTGLASFMDFFNQFAEPKPVQAEVKNFVELVAEDDLVVIATLATYQDANNDAYTTTWFDLFRLDGGMIIEHWDTATIPL